MPQSETLFAITGATGVCFISYVFPVLAYRNFLRMQTRGGVTVRQRHSGIEYVAMAAVLIVGVAVSVCSFVTILDGLFFGERDVCKA